jgi:hypothetical protein
MGPKLHVLFETLVFLALICPTKCLCFSLKMQPKEFLRWKILNFHYNDPYEIFLITFLLAPL